LKLVQGATIPKYRIAGGLLEEILDDEKHAARGPLLWRNYFFGRRQRKIWKNPSFRLKASNAPLHMHPYILDEVLKYVRFPKPLADEYRSFGKTK
jgi:hypothetical protein